MSEGEGTGRGDAAEFERAMHGVEPVGDQRRRAFRRARRESQFDEQAARFEVTREGSRCYGLRVGAASQALQELRSGKLPAENTLDLHGMSEEAARESVFGFVRQSHRSGLRCVALVHGRGLRSPGGAVLREAARGWLVQLPLSRHVEAFASAPREWGGDGTTLVLLTPRGVEAVR